jgi:hypothetical protein
MKITDDEQRELARLLDQAEIFRQDIIDQAKAPRAAVVERKAVKTPMQSHQGG